MPISQILPNGRVRIYNNNTGETKDVKPEELGAYSPKLVGQYQTAIAQRDAIKEGQLTQDNIPQTDRTLTSSALAASGYTPQDKAKREAKGDTLKKAEAVIDVIGKNKSGQLKGKEYEDAMASIASQYTASKAFGEGGKALTAPELAILSGQLPVIEKRVGNPIDKAIAWAQGREVAQRGVVVDSRDEVERKMILAIAALKGEKVDPNKLNAVAGSGQAGGGEGPSFGQLAGNAGKNIMQLLDPILKATPSGVAKGAMGAATAPLQNGNPLAWMQALTNPMGAARGNIAASMLPGMVSEYDQALGQPRLDKSIQDTAQDAGARAYEKPVSTALDLLPFLGAKAAVGRGGKTPAPKAGPEALAPEIARSDPNLLQKIIRSSTDTVQGSGSKEYIARTAGRTGKEGALPQNQVLMDEGILLHPTASGKIKATSGAINKYGTDLENAYKGSDRVFKGDSFGKLFDEKLKGKGYDSKATSYIKDYISQQGGFDMASGDNLITMEKAWTVAKNLEKSPPKMLKNPESAAQYRELSKDAARVIREELGAKVPETKGLNSRYSALRDYMDNVLPAKTEGLPSHGLNSVAGFVPNAVKSTMGVGGNALYRALGVDPRKLIRDKRTKTENLRFRQQ